MTPERALKAFAPKINEHLAAVLAVESVQIRATMLCEMSDGWKGIIRQGLKPAKFSTQVWDSWEATAKKDIKAVFDELGRTEPNNSEEAEAIINLQIRMARAFQDIVDAELVIKAALKATPIQRAQAHAQLMQIRAQAVLEQLDKESLPTTPKPA